MSFTHFDTIVIGSGTAAYFAVDGLVQAGQRVAIVDERPYGGTCALRGCQPKKYLVSNAEAVALVSQLVGRGIKNPAHTDWKALQALKNQFLEGRSEADVRQWQKKGVTTLHGKAVLTGPETVRINDQQVTADTIILATGALPRANTLPGAEHIQDSEYFLNLSDLPKRLLFIGGGYISFEFAHVAARAGAEEVTILHRSAEPLKSFDQDAVEAVVHASREVGIKVILNTHPTAITPGEEGFLLHDSTGTEHPVDCIIGAIGRVPNLSVLAGNHGRVDHDERGVRVNQYLQSISNPRVYAIGDCAATKHMLAPVADQEGKTVVRNILESNSTPLDTNVVPSVVFTIPCLATVGHSEQSAAALGSEYRVNAGETKNWPSSKRIGEAHGYYKVLIDKATDEILGAHLTRHNADEVINIFALAIRHRIPAGELAEFLWAYPTFTSDIKYMVR